jgi:DeoR family fructose operon transcriptional repressor
MTDTSQIAEAFGVLVDERRQTILQLVEKKGFVTLNQLMDLVGASDSTIRRDLEVLDGNGQIRRTRGGATYVGESLTSFDVRRTRARKQKENIAEAAAALVQTGETVILDGGTTTVEVARELVGRSLQVVTNSIPIVNALVNSPETELIVIGGFLYPKTGVNLGPLAVEALRSIHARRLFISVGGITANSLFNSNALLVETERQMIEAAEEVIVVSDSSKLGHSALALLCPLETVDRLITDAGITDEWREICEAAGIELIVVEG